MFYKRNYKFHIISDNTSKKTGEWFIHWVELENDLFRVWVTIMPSHDKPDEFVKDLTQYNVMSELKDAAFFCPKLKGCANNVLICPSIAGCFSTQQTAMIIESMQSSIISAYELEKAMYEWMDEKLKTEA